MGRPRTFWPALTNRLPSENRMTSPSPGSTPRWRQIAAVIWRLPDPPKTRSSSMLTPNSGDAAIRVRRTASCLCPSADNVLGTETAHREGQEHDRVRGREHHALDHVGPYQVGLQGVGPGELPVRRQELPPVPE